MPDLADGETTEMNGSGAKPYQLRNVGGVLLCSCPAWREPVGAIETRTCKHLRKLRGDAAETERIGAALPQKPITVKGDEAAGPPLLLAESWDTPPTSPLVDEREARRRPRLVGRQAIPLPAAGTSSTPRTGSSKDCPERRSTANSGSTARPSSGRWPSSVARTSRRAGDRALPRLRRPAGRRAVRGAAQVPADGFAKWKPKHAAIHGHALCRDGTTCGPNWPASKRWAARG
jgi:hypothetical protein